MLFHVAYASTATADFSRVHLLELLRSARQKNRLQGISGVLLYQDGHFFQVIEGTFEAVQSLYAIIEKDPRHCQMVKIIEEPIFQRDFPDWSMGLAEADEHLLRSIDGLNDYLQQGSVLTGLTPGRAGKLIQAFKQGRWRQQIMAGGVS